MNWQTFRTKSLRNDAAGLASPGNHHVTRVQYFLSINKLTLFIFYVTFSTNMLTTKYSMNDPLGVTEEIGKNPIRIRDHNRKIILSLLRQHGQLGRKELAEITRLLGMCHLCLLYENFRKIKQKLLS